MQFALLGAKTASGIFLFLRASSDARFSVRAFLEDIGGFLRLIRPKLISAF